jgi:lysophospholipase L1-like esterase
VGQNLVAQMVTIMIGANDFCSHTCYLKNFSIMPQLHKENLIKALDYLKDKMPRTIVNLVPPPREYVLNHAHDLQWNYISQLCACGLATTRNKLDVTKKN